MEVKLIQIGNDFLKRLSVNTDKCYEIIIDNGFDTLIDELSRLFPPTVSYFLITDSNVAPIYSAPICAAAQNRLYRIYELIVNSGENSKNIDTLSLIYKFLLKNGADRSSVIIALGGGVIGDLAGLAAATYMRGIRYVQIPTTLLAQVDSSVGGKTAVDFLGYKNIIGAFYQPDLVYINVSTLETLPEREFASGMAEVVKYGLISDAELFGYIRENAVNLRNNSVLIHIISKCVEIKANIVEKDEKDVGIREFLNFGHTAGHAVESLKHFELLHGEAVSLGMIVAVDLSAKFGNTVEPNDVTALLELLSLPVKIAGLNSNDIYNTMLKDKKSRAGKISYVLLKRVGQAYTSTDVTCSDILNSLEAILKED